MKLLILGGGGHGLVCKEIAESTGIYDVIDLADDAYACGATISGFLSDAERYKREYDGFFIGVGNMELRRKLIAKIEEYGLSAPSLISPAAYVSKSAKIGKGVFIGHGAIVNANSTVGDFAVLGIGSLVEHNSAVLPNAYLRFGEKVGTNEVKR